MEKKFQKNNDGAESKNILQNLKTAGKVLRATKNKKEVLDFTIDIFEKLGFDRIRIWLVNEEKEIIQGAKSNYLPDKKFQKASMSLDSRMNSLFFLRALKAKKPYYNKDNSLLRGALKDYTVKETIGLPIIAGKKLLGDIGIDNATTKRPLSFRKQEIENTVMPFVNQIAVTLDRVLLIEKLTKAKGDLQKEIETLRDLSITGESLRTTKNQNQVLNFAIRTFLKLGFDRVRVWLIDKEKQIYRGAKCSYMSDKKFSKAQASLEGKVLPKNYVSYLKKKKPYLNNSTPLIRKFFNDKTEYTVGLPLLAGKQLLGVISVDNSISKREINLKEMEIKVMPFVNHIALVLNRITIDEKLQQANLRLKNKVAEATQELKAKNAELNKLALYDELSNLPNRRYLKTFIQEAFENASAKKPLGYVMMDIDFLKHANDTRGHERGDRLIKQIGEVLNQEDGVDFVARFAGDEFVLVFLGKTHQEKHHTLKKIMRKIHQKTGNTVSAGCATYPSPEIKTPIDLMRRADDALYHAKHTGRNKFVCAMEEKEMIGSLIQRRFDLQKIEAQGTFAIDFIHQLRVINKISEHFRNFPNEKTALGKIASSIKKELDFYRVGVFLKMESGELELVAHSREKDTRLARIIKYPKEIPILNRKLIQTMKGRKVLDATMSKKSPKHVFDYKIEKTLLIPLIGRKHVIGVAVAQYNPTRIFRESDFNFLLALGDQIESGITKARAVEKVEGFNRQLKKEISAATEKLRKYSSSLEEQIFDNLQLREDELKTHFELISALVASLEEKDVYTRGHSVRVASYTMKIGRKLGLREKQLTNLRYSALLHDIGKVAIDQSILHKRTALTEAEAKELEKHPVVGEKIVSAVRFLKETAHAIRHHHERWDGKGYPDGEKRENIPLEARIIGVADAYDAMVTRRSYGHKMSKSEAIRELKLGSGKQFDPKIAKLFIKLLQEGKISKPKSKFVK